MNDQDSNGILTEAQTEEIRNKFLTPAQRLAKEKQDAEAKRKRDERAREKAAKEMGQIATKEDFWRRNHCLLPKAELDALLERQEAVFDLTFAMRKYIDGIYERTTDEEDRVPLEAIIEEVQEEVGKHGTVTMEVVLLGGYWKDAELYERFQGNALRVAPRPALRPS